MHLKKLLLLPEDGFDERSTQFLYLASFEELMVESAAKNGYMSILRHISMMPHQAGQHF